MWWRSGDCERERNGVSDKREQQQQSGSLALHASSVNQSPTVGKHRTEFLLVQPA
jgi:hypothetical protein